jgi:hypothetical protein
VIEPLFHFKDRYLMRYDTPEYLWGWAPCACGIRKFLQQTSSQRLQQALFVTLGISHCLRIPSIQETLSRYPDNLELAA